MPIFRITGQHRRDFSAMFLWFQIKLMGFRIASEKNCFRIANGLGVCDSNRMAHRGCIARFWATKGKRVFQREGRAADTQRKGAFSWMPGWGGPSFARTFQTHLWFVGPVENVEDVLWSFLRPLFPEIALRPEMITQIIRKQFFCVTDVCAIAHINSQTINVCNWHVHWKYVVEAPNYTKEFLPESPV